jgi:Zn-dependent peptidase ImmA (M78 family)/DNA-binding XRE family transcriptional regulator
MFNPTRLTLARRRRGLSKTVLASQVGIDVRSIAAYEDGEFEPSADVRLQIYRVLGFSKDFFEGSDIEVPKTEAVSFRSLSKRTAAQRDSALAAGGFAFHFNDWINRHFQLPQINLPRLEQLDPEGASITLRRHFGLGELPIRHVLKLLEAHGVRFFALGDIADEIDAFSLWRDECPFVFLNTGKSAERSRFDTCHELGHLVLHRQGSPEGRQAEEEANAFASSFLLPERGLKGSLPGMVTLPILLKLKRHWGVSAFAMVYRLHKIGVLSEWQYRTLCIELAKKGYKSGEPDGAQRETSAVLEKVTAAMRERGIGVAQLASELTLPVSELNGLMLGLAPISLDGGRSEASTARLPTKLRVIK